MECTEEAVSDGPQYVSTPVWGLGVGVTCRRKERAGYEVPMGLPGLLFVDNVERRA